MRQWLPAAAAVLAAVLAFVPSTARAQYDDLRYERSVQQGGQRGERGEYRDDRRRSREEYRRPEYDRGGSLTPDERRDLNRDLQRANREFYRKGRERQ